MTAGDIQKRFESTLEEEGQGSRFSCSSCSQGHVEKSWEPRPEGQCRRDPLQPTVLCQKQGLQAAEGSATHGPLGTWRVMVK